MLDPLSENRREIERQLADAFPEALGLAERLYEEAKRLHEKAERTYGKDFFEPGILEELLSFEVGYTLLIRQLVRAHAGGEGDKCLQRILDWVEQSYVVYGTDAHPLAYWTANEILESAHVERIHAMTGQAVRRELVAVAELITNMANSFELNVDQWDNDYSAFVESCREQVATYRRAAAKDRETT